MFDIPYSFAKQTDEPVLYIVRHGATGDDDSYNSPVDPSLNENGVRDADEAAEWLEGRGINALIASEHKRAKETADIIGKRLGLTPKPDKRIDSLDVGDVKDEKSAEEADRVVQHHVKNKHLTIPGGESVLSFENRIDPVLREGLQHFRKTGKPSAMVTHHSVQHEAGRFFNGHHDTALTRTGGVVAVYMTPKGFKAVPVFKPENVKAEGSEWKPNTPVTA